jgi:hypothetical protein
VSDVLKRCSGNDELIAQANAKIQALRETIPLNVAATNKADILTAIKNTLESGILKNTQFKHNLRIWENKVVVIDILDLKIAYDIIPSGDSIAVKIVVRKSCDMGTVNKLYPLFPKGKDRKTIFITSVSTMETLLVDFIKNEIDRVTTKGLIIKQVQSA